MIKWATIIYKKLYVTCHTSCRCNKPLLIQLPQPMNKVKKLFQKQHFQKSVKAIHLTKRKKSIYRKDFYSILSKTPGWSSHRTCCERSHLPHRWRDGELCSHLKLLGKLHFMTWQREYNISKTDQRIELVAEAKEIVVGEMKLTYIEGEHEITVERNKVLSLAKTASICFFHKYSPVMIIIMQLFFEWNVPCILIQTNFVSSAGCIDWFLIKAFPKMSWWNVWKYE